MPIKPNFFERALFYNLNMAPSPLLDLAGALSYQAVSAASRLGLFDVLGDRSMTPAEAAAALKATEPGVQALLQALAATGYVSEKDGRYRNSPSTAKWLLEEELIDMGAAVSYWDELLTELWPHATDVLRNGERPFDFYEWVEEKPSRSDAFQRMMVANASLAGPDIVKKVDLPGTASRLLDVGGGHGMFSIIFCQQHPDLRATILDSPAALETTRVLVEQHGLSGRIECRPGDLWQAGWGEGYDAVLLFNLLHHFDLEANQKLLDLAAGALKPGGRVAVLEQIEGKVNGAASEAFVRLIALQYFLAVGGRVFTREEMDHLLAGAGFTNARFVGSPGRPVRT